MDLSSDIGPPDSTILVVGRVLAERASFARIFRSEGFQTVEAADAEAAEAIVASTELDLIVLDDRLPRHGAYEFCRKHTTRGGAPVLLIAQSADETDRIIALEVGADNLLTKPVNPRLLLAETRALLRRSAGRASRLPDAEPAPSNPGDWSIDVMRRVVTAPCGRQVSLSPDQVTLFAHFLEYPGVVQTWEALAEPLGWQEDALVRTRTRISRLNRRMAEFGLPAVIRNVRGSGYVFDPDADMASAGPKMEG